MIIGYLFRDTAAVWIGWLVLSILAGAIVLKRDEARLRRRRRPSSEVQAYADRLAVAFGENPLAGWLAALQTSHSAQDIERRHFYDQVCEELIRRHIVGESEPARAEEETRSRGESEERSKPQSMA